MIELQNVTKLYGRVIGVNDITLSMPPGAYGLLGPNGSGKSTLLNLLIGQLSPSIGQVQVFGKSPVNNAELFRRIGYCPSGEGLYSDVSGYDWVTFLQEMGGMSTTQARQVSEETLVMTGLKDAMHRPISSYSRGMRQRVKIAQAIAHDPDFLILDEPFSGLDPIGRNQMSVLMNDWIKRGKSLILATHVLHEVESVTSSFLLMYGGRLLAFGNSHDVQEMLSDTPNQISIRCHSPRKLASGLMSAGIGDSYQVQGDQLTISLQNSGQFFQELPGILQSTGVIVTEILSAEESLTALFNSLLQIHRGEK